MPRVSRYERDVNCRVAAGFRERMDAVAERRATSLGSLMRQYLERGLAEDEAQIKGWERKMRAVEAGAGAGGGEAPATSA